MRAVDQDRQTGVVHRRDQGLDGEAETGRGRDVVERDEPGAWPDLGHDAVDDLLDRRDIDGDVRLADDHARA